MLSWPRLPLDWFVPSAGASDQAHKNAERSSVRETLQVRLLAQVDTHTVELRRIRPGQTDAQHSKQRRHAIHRPEQLLIRHTFELFLRIIPRGVSDESDYLAG